MCTAETSHVCISKLQYSKLSSYFYTEHPWLVLASFSRFKVLSNVSPLADISCGRAVTRTPSPRHRDVQPRDPEPWQPREVIQCSDAQHPAFLRGHVKFSQKSVSNYLMSFPSTQRCLIWRFGKQQGSDQGLEFLSITVKTSFCFLCVAGCSVYDLAGAHCGQLLLSLASRPPSRGARTIPAHRSVYARSDSCHLPVQTLLFSCCVLPSTYYCNRLFMPSYWRPGQKEEEMTLKQLSKEAAHSLWDVQGTSQLQTRRVSVVFRDQWAGKPDGTDFYYTLPCTCCSF